MPSGSATFFQSAKCDVDFSDGLMDGFERRAGEFELAARLERDRAAGLFVVQADDVVALHDRHPAELFVHAVEQRADPIVAVQHCLRRGPAYDRPDRREFLVLGADAENAAGLAPSAPHATSSSRDVIGVESETSRAILRLSFSVLHRCREELSGDLAPSLSASMVRNSCLRRSRMAVIKQDPLGIRSDVR